MLNDALDTFFKYVKARIIAANNGRTVVGIIEANDWPPKDVMPNAFYLLTLGDVPNRNGGSASALNMIHLVQWVWTIPGDDLTQDQLGHNRGNRYRINWQMKTELVRGMFPGFCPKNSYTPQIVNGAITSVPTPSGDTITWSAPRFMKTNMLDKSGIIYCGAQVHISQFADSITS